MASSCGGIFSAIFATSAQSALFAAVIDSIVGEIVRPLPDIDVLPLGLRETLIVVARQHMATVLSEKHIALARLVAAEAAHFPEVGHAYYEHGPARGHAKLEQYFARQVASGSLRVRSVRRAADYFWGMLLHHAPCAASTTSSRPPRPKKFVLTALPRSTHFSRSTELRRELSARRVVDACDRGLRAPAEADDNRKDPTRAARMLRGCAGA